MSSIKKAGVQHNFCEMDEQKDYAKCTNTSSDSDSESVKNLVIDIGEASSVKLQCSDTCQLADDNKLDKSLKMTIKRKSKCTEKHEVISNDVSKLSDVVQKCKITTANYVDSNIVKNKGKSKANKNMKALKESDKDASDPYNFNNEEQVMLPSAKRARLDKNESGSNVIQRSQHHVEINTNSAEMSTTVEPDLLGPCDPGTAINLDGIVWLETATGMLVVNVTWRGRTYVGTLLDATQHEFAPPSPKTYESAMDQAARNQRRRGRRRGGLSTQAVRAMLSSRSNNRRHVPPLTNATNNVSNGANACGVGASSSIGSNNGTFSSSATSCSGTGNNADTDSDSSNHALLIEPPLFGCPQPGCCKRFPDILAMKFHHNETHRRKPTQSPEPITTNRLFSDTASSSVVSATAATTETLHQQHQQQPSLFSDVGSMNLSMNDGNGDVVFKHPTNATANTTSSSASKVTADSVNFVTVSSSDLFSSLVSSSLVPNFGTAALDSSSFSSLAAGTTTSSCSRNSPVPRCNVTTSTVSNSSVGSRVKTVTVEGTFPVPVGSPGGPGAPAVCQGKTASSTINKDKGNKTTVSAAIYPVPFMVTSNEFVTASNCDAMDFSSQSSLFISSNASSSSSSSKCKKTTSEIKNVATATTTALTTSAGCVGGSANLGTYAAGSLLNLKPIQPKPTVGQALNMTAEAANVNTKLSSSSHVPSLNDAGVAPTLKDKKTKKRKVDSRNVTVSGSTLSASSGQATNVMSVAPSAINAHTKRSMSVDEAGALSYILPSQHHYHAAKCNSSSAGKPDSPRRRGDSPRKADNPASPAYSDISDGSPAPVLEKEADLGGKGTLPPPTLSLPSTCVGEDNMLKLPITGGAAATLISYPFFSHPPNLLPAVQATSAAAAACLSGSSAINTSANVLSSSSFDTTTTATAVNGNCNVQASLNDVLVASSDNLGATATDLSSHASNRGSPNAPNKPSIGSSPTEEKRSQGEVMNAQRPRKHEKNSKTSLAAPSPSSAPSTLHQQDERVSVKRERDLDDKHAATLSTSNSRSTHSPAAMLSNHDHRFRSHASSKRDLQADHRSSLDSMTLSQTLLSPTPRNLSRAPPGLTNFPTYPSCYPPPPLGPMLPAGYDFCMPPPPPPPSSMNAWPPLPHFSSVLSPSHFAASVSAEKSLEALGHLSSSHYVGLPTATSSSSASAAHKIHELARCEMKGSISSSTSVSSSSVLGDASSGNMDVGIDTVKSPPTLRHAHTHSHMHMFSGSPLGPGGAPPSGASHSHLSNMEHFPYSPGSILHTHHNSLSSPFLPK